MWSVELERVREVPPQSFGGERSEAAGAGGPGPGPDAAVAVAAVVAVAAAAPAVAVAVASVLQQQLLHRFLFFLLF